MSKQISKLILIELFYV